MNKLITFFILFVSILNPFFIFSKSNDLFLIKEPRSYFIVTAVEKLRDIYERDMSDGYGGPSYYLNAVIIYDVTLDDETKIKIRFDKDNWKDSRVAGPLLHFFKNFSLKANDEIYFRPIKSSSLEATIIREGKNLGTYEVDRATIL